MENRTWCFEESKAVKCSSFDSLIFSHTGYPVSSFRIRCIPGLILYLKSAYSVNIHTVSFLWDLFYYLENSQKITHFSVIDILFPFLVAKVAVRFLYLLRWKCGADCAPFNISIEHYKTFAGCGPHQHAVFPPRRGRIVAEPGRRNGAICR